MSSFGNDKRSIDGVKNASDYARRLLTSDELIDTKHFELLLTWWKRTYEDKQCLPSRSDFNPAIFKSILPYIAILEPVYRDKEVVDFVSCLIGTELAKVFGEQTGSLITQSNSVYITHTVLTAGKECIRRREPIGLTSKAVSEGMPFMSSYALYCPLARDHNHIDKLLIHVSFEQHVELTSA